MKNDEPRLSKSRLSFTGPLESSERYNDSTLPARSIRSMVVLVVVASGGLRIIKTCRESLDHTMVQCPNGAIGARSRDESDIVETATTCLSAAPSGPR